MSVADEEIPGRSQPGQPSLAGSGAHGSTVAGEDLLERLERGEPEQPLVFFRDGWDFRWMSGRQVLARLGLGEPTATIVDERGDFDEPPELTEFCRQFGALLRGGTQPPSSEPDVAALGREVRQALRRRRPSIVLPGSAADEARFVLRLGIELGAAFVLPPDPSAYVWTVCSTRPTILVAAPELLRELAADLRARSSWRRRRLVSATRFVLELASSSDHADPSNAPARDALASLMPLLAERTQGFRVALRPRR